MIQDLFQQTVNRYPQKTAINANGQSITFATLNKQANQIADQLFVRQASPFTGIYMDLSIDCISAILAVLKSGKAYVPLNIKDPAYRVKQIIEDAGIELIITNDDFEAIVQNHFPSLAVLNINQLETELSITTMAQSKNANQLAYVYFTSGSTGRPKGVCQSHRNLCHFVNSYINHLTIHNNDRLSGLYSFCFSAINMDIYSCLFSGATLYLYNINEFGLHHLPQWIAKNEISILHMVPTVYRQFLQNHQNSNQLESIRAIDLGGEHLDQSDIKLLNKSFRNKPKLVNHYAATEASVIAQYDINEHLQYENKIPVGLAAPGIEIKTVKDDGSEALANETGNIVIYSPFITPGYLSNDALNQEVFAEDLTRPGWRIYRTQDLGILNTNNELTFIGRSGSMVKISGYSVDITEVESVIKSVLNHNDVAVIAKNNDAQTFLVAFLGHIDFPEEYIRGKLIQNLAPYMIPKEIIILDQLPVTNALKIDRQQLCHFDIAKSNRQNSLDFNQPKSFFVIQTHHIFENILKKSINDHDANFFHLGGNSLALSELQLQMEKAFNINLFLPELLDYNSINKLSLLVKRKMVTNIETHGILRPIRTQGSKAPLFIVHGIKGFTIISQAFINIIDPDQPIYCLNAKGFNGNEQPFDNIPDMAKEYIKAIKTVQSSGPYCLMSFCNGVAVLLEMTDQLQHHNNPIAPVILFDPHEKILISKIRLIKRKLTKKLRLAELKEFEKEMRESIPVQDGSSQNIVQINNNKQRINKHSNITDILNHTRLFVKYFKYALYDYQLKQQNIDAIRIFSPTTANEKKAWLKIIKGSYIEKPIKSISRHDEIFNFANQEIIDNLSASLKIVYGYLATNQN